MENNVYNALIKETGHIISARRIDYTAQRRLKEISRGLCSVSDIPAFDKDKAWDNIMTKYNNARYAGALKAPAVRPRFMARMAVAAMIILLTLNLMTVIFAKTNIVTYLYDFHNGALTVRQADYNIEEKSTEYAKYFSSVYDGVKYFGADIPLPHMLPSEYALNKVYCSTDRERIVISYISSDYDVDGKEISYSVSRLFNDHLEINEDEAPKTVVFNDITYYVMHNMDRTVIQWVYRDMNCYITSPMSEGELLEIVKNMR